MKKIIALAVAAAFVAPVAMAEVTVYGGLRTSVEYSKISSPSLDGSKVRLVDQSSRLGFKGSDKLDNGLTVLWQAEQRVRVGTHKADGTNDVQSTGWGDRDTFVGLQGDFGLVRAGKFDDIIDASRGDFFSALGDLEETGGSSGRFVRRGNAKNSNTIAYHSPSFGGFGFKVQGVMGNDTAAGNANGYAATAFYKHSLFDIGAGYKAMNDFTGKEIQNTATVSPGGEYEYYVVGASVKPMAGLTISAAWDRTSSKASASAADVKQDGYGIGATYVTGKYAFNGNIAKLNDTKNAANNADTGAWGANLSMNYALSKQTKLTAGATYIKNDARSALTTNTSSYAGTDGAKLTSVSVGIHTNF